MYSVHEFWTEIRIRTDGDKFVQKVEIQRKKWEEQASVCQGWRAGFFPALLWGVFKSSPNDWYYLGTGII